MLIGLGIFAFADRWANENPEVYKFIDQVDRYLKLGVTIAVNTTVLEPQVAKAIFNISEGGIGGNAIPIAVAACPPGFFLANFRKEILSYLRSLDEENDIGLLTLANWLEDGWIFFGVIFLLVLPLLTIFLILIGFLILVVINKSIKAHEEKKKINCESCDELIYQTALACPKCKGENKNARNVGVLGQTLSSNISDIQTHKMNLIALKKCPEGATRLNEKTINQTCPNCRTLILNGPKGINFYVDSIDKRLKKILIFSFLIGFVPIIGSIVTIIYSKIFLVKPYSQYISFTKGIWLRFLAKLGIFIMVIVQIIPIVGYFSCPAIALIYHFSWKSGFEKEYSLA